MIAEVSTLHHASQKDVHSENEKCESCTDTVLQVFSDSHESQSDGENKFGTPDDKEVKSQSKI